MSIPKEKHQSVMRESEIVPAVAATQLVQEKAKKVAALKIDPETPESLMLKQSADAGKTRNTLAG